MRIIIAGGTGFIGEALTNHFLKKGDEVAIIGRDKEKTQTLFASQVIAISWDEFSEHGRDLILTSDLIINLAGASIAAKRWSPKRKYELLESRVRTTKLIVESCEALGQNSPPLFNASALSIYGLQKEINTTQPFTEKSRISDEDHDFAAKIIKEWEKATEPARMQGVRVVNMRFAVVLGKKGLLAKLILPYQLGLGGIIGNGQQPFAWIALSDLISAIEFIYQQPHIEGPVNFVSPHCITQAEFAKALAKVLHRPCFMQIPGSFLKILFGEMAETLLLNGQCVHPEVLLDNGFQFKYPNLPQALESIF